jgi:hypothetical protein
MVQRRKPGERPEENVVIKLAQMTVVLAALLAMGCGGPMEQQSGAGGGGVGQSGSGGGTQQQQQQNACSTACSTSSDCPQITCTCGDGSPYSYQQCTNGCCATTTAACPSNNVGSGGTCTFACNCASNSCQFGLPSTCQ